MPRVREQGDLFLARVDRLWPVGPDVVAGVIHGQLPNKSNSREIVRVGGRFLLIRSKEARRYDRRFESAIERSSGLVQIDPEARLYFKATVHQENLRRDLDVELLPDLLQKFEIIKNDRAIWRKEYERRLDRENPRVEFEIGVLKEEIHG